MMRRIIRWLTRADIRPTPEEYKEPENHAQIRADFHAAHQRADRALTELHRMERMGRGKHG
jgi:hypothetical protein